MKRLSTIAASVGDALRSRGLMLATAESCTGGGVAQWVTSCAGSSGWFERGFITYSNDAKREMLGVRAESLERYGAVSEQVAVGMAEGALVHSSADVSVAVSGIAGPSGGAPEKPVGTVCLAWAVKGGETRARTARFGGEREAVRLDAVEAALQGVLELIKN